MLDDPTCDLRKNSGAADATIEAIEHAEMVSKLCPIPEQAQLDRDVERFSPTPAPEPGLNMDFIKSVLDMGSARLQRRAEIAKESARRRRELRQLTEDCLSDLLPRSDSVVVADCNYWLDRFAESAEKLCSEVLLEAS